MIQNLENKKLYNEYEKTAANPEDKVFCFDQDRMLIKKEEDDTITLPTAVNFPASKLQYLFRINEERYFLAIDIKNNENVIEGCTSEFVRNLRNLEDRELAFAAATAYHLYQWYRDNKFCGRCGQSLQHANAERMLKCPACGNMVYPKIAPAVIVAVTNGDKIVMTKYNGRAYKRYALIAGFTEIGETAEETVKREVMEEVGLTVKNVRYYKSQPWGTEQDLLLGFFCELDGDDTINMDEDELSTAEWVSRHEMDIEDDGFSLTREMMCAFKSGNI